MKKSVQFLIACLLLLSFVSVKAQVTVFSSNLETWSGNVPVGLVGVKTNLLASQINPYTVSAYSPVTAVKLENTTTSIKRFTTLAHSVTNGTVYTVTYWVRGHGDIKVGLFDGRSTGSGYFYNSTYTTINSSSWTQQTATVTAATDTSKAEFIFGIKNTLADIDHLQIDDIVITRPGTPDPTISIYSPADGSTLYSADVPVAFDVNEFVVGNPGTGIDGHIHYYLDANPLVMQYSTLPIMLTSLAAGPHTIILQLVDNSHLPLVPNKADTLNFTVDLTLPNPQTIHDIQYTTASPANSPFNNTLTSTTGIVTGVAPAGYFIQDLTGMWNGIYVYDNLHHPAIGDNVSLTGTIKEYYGYTEFTGIVGFTVLSTGQTLPLPTTVNGADIVDTIAGEAYEGVLVKIGDVPCSKIANSYGEWQVFDGDSANVDDLMFHYTPVLGTHYDITGIIYLTFGQDFIEPRDSNDVQIHTGINELSAASANISVYPNPAADVLFVSNMSGATSLKITNLLGSTIKDVSVKGDDAKVNVENLSSGIYVLTLIKENKVIAAKKFSIE